MDPNVVTFVVEFYEILTNSIKEIANVYAEGAKLIVFQGKEAAKIYVSNYERVLNPEKRKITLVSGKVIGSHLFVHVQSEITQKGEKLISDESFVCLMKDTSILILYHTIHINPLLEPIVVLPPPPKVVHTVVKPKVEKKPAEEVANVTPLKKSNCIIINNLPYNKPPKEFIPVMEKYGKVLRFYQMKGRLVVEYEKVEEVYKAKEAYYSEWNGRTPRVFRPPKDYNWNEL